MKYLTRLFGKTRQGYYKQVDATCNKLFREEMILKAVKSIRARSKTQRWGARKLHQLVNKELSALNISVGRDKLFDLLRTHNMLVRKRKRRYYTTQSHHWLHKYDNLIEDKELTSCNQVWVSDITYIKCKEQVYYLYLITDAYSEKIVGWNLSDDLKTESAVEALKMAFKANKGRIKGLIHHSDRGVQYCSEAYVRLLKKHHIEISMTKAGSPHENAIAERVNGILKEEWVYDMNFDNLKKGKKQIGEIIEIYNCFRPHNSLMNQTPQVVHKAGSTVQKASRVVGKTYQYRKKKKDNSTNYLKE